MMMEKLKTINLSTLKKHLRTSGITLHTGPFNTHLRSSIPEIAKNIYRLYDEHSISFNKSFSDFHLIVKEPNFIRRWYRPQVNFTFDGVAPFQPLPKLQAFAIFEWGLNWCISTYSHQFLIIHAAVLEKDGVAIILPGVPGAGKSTLCAGLMLNGWRLFSDEMALIEPTTGQLISNPRPISLKNESIDIIKEYSSAAIFGTRIHDTTKGTVAHLKPSRDSVLRSDQTATPMIIAFPMYKSGVQTAAIPMTKSSAFIKLCDNSFNYNVLGKNGFNVIQSIIDRCKCLQIQYSDLDSITMTINTLANEINNQRNLKRTRDI